MLRPAELSPFVWLPILYLLAAALRAGLEYGQTLLIAATGQAAMRDLRKVVFDHVQLLHQAFFDRYPVGRLVTRATSDVENVAEMFSAGLVLLLTDVLRMVGFATVLFLVDAPRAHHPSRWYRAAGAAFVFRLKVRDAFRSTRVLLADQRHAETDGHEGELQLSPGREPCATLCVWRRAQERGSSIWYDSGRLPWWIRAGRYHRHRALGGRARGQRGPTSHGLQGHFFRRCAISPAYSRDAVLDGEPSASSSA